MTDMDPSLLELAPAYALGALDADEARRFEAFLATSPEARREVAQFREVAALLALGGDAAPSASLRDRVLAAAPRPAASVAPLAARRRSAAARTVPWLAAAASIALAALFWRDVASLRRQVSNRDGELAARAEAIQRQEATIRSLVAPGVEVYELSATGAAAPGMKVFVDRERGRAQVSAYRLQPAATGRTYQLWFIRDGTPVPSVTFTPDPSGLALLTDVEIPPGAGVTAAAVTEEPAGGSPAPTSAPFLAGAIRRS